MTINLVLGHTTQHAKLVHVDIIKKSVDFGCNAVNLLVDRRKTFDTVSHSILVNRFIHIEYGVIF